MKKCKIIVRNAKCFPVKNIRFAQAAEQTLRSRQKAAKNAARKIPILPSNANSAEWTCLNKSIELKLKL